MNDPGLRSYQDIEVPEWYEYLYTDGGYQEEEEDEEDDST